MYRLLHYRGIATNYTDIVNLSDLTSDHSPIILTLSDKLIYKQTTPKLTNKYTEWEVYRQSIHSKINLQVRLKTPHELELAANDLTTALIDSAKAATSNTVIKPTTVSYPKEVLRLVRERRKARHRWQSTRTPQDKTIFNRISKDTKKAIKEVNEKTFNDLVQSLGTTKEADYSLWKIAKATRKPNSYLPPLRTSRMTWARSDVEKADEFANHLETVFQTNDITSDVNPIIEERNGPVIKPFSPKEIKKAIDKELNPKKAPGHDLISARMLQELPRKGVVMLTQLFNTVLRIRYIPKDWKKAKIIMLLKPGKPPEDPTSYRPISLLSVIAKLFEKLFITRLRKITDDLGVIPDHQFGFRGKQATTEQIHRVTSTIRNALEKKQHCPTLFLDVSQAFDKVWVPGLLHKLSKYLPVQYIQILESYLHGRQFRVHFGEAESSVRPIAAGVPQGSVLGPHLYLLYTADIPTHSDILTATFADDTALAAAHEDYDTAVSNLQRIIDEVSQWTKRWKIKLNSEKSTRVDFSLRPHNYTPTYIEGQPVNEASSARYLGVHLDKKLTWKAHLTTKRNELNLRFRAMFWLFNVRNKLTLENKRLLYIAVLRPVWTYAIQLWGCTADSHYLIIQRFQNKVLRKMVGAPWFLSNEQLHRDLNIDYVKTIASRYTLAYERRLHHHPNVEAIQLLETPIRRLKRKHPIDVA